MDSNALFLKRSDAAKRAVETRRLRNPDWGIRSAGHKYWQRMAVNYVRAAVAIGLLPSLSAGDIACVDCGRNAYCYDHRDYSMPLVVVPVCGSCNSKRGPAKCPTD